MEEQGFSRSRARLDQSCVGYDALLTTHFDGQASADEAARADAHLATCAQCESLWHSWSQSRLLLQRLPSPNAPPFLLARILTICRLASLRSEKAMEEGWIIDATMLPAPAPPSFLKEEILRRTVGANDSISAAREAILDGQTMGAPSLHTGFAFWENARRALAATALPAAALLVIVFSQRPPEPLSSPAKQYSRTPQTTIQSANEDDGAPKSAIAAPPKTVAFTPRAARFVVPPKLGAPVFALAARPAFARGKIAFEPLPKFEPISFPAPRPPKSSQQSPKKTVMSTAPHKSTAPRSSTLPSVTPALWHPMISEIRMQPIKSVSPAAFKVTIPISPLLATLVVENSETSDENDVLDLVSRARDNRPDDVREAMDDFRALLASSSWDEK